MTPLRESWDLAYRVADRHGMQAWIEDGRVYLDEHCMFDAAAPRELNQTRRDVLRGLLEAPGVCTDCGARATGIDLKRGVEVCDAHRPQQEGDRH